MKIVHVSDCYLPQVGGIELHIRDLAAAQRAAGHQVLVATSTAADHARAGSIATDRGEEILRVGAWERRWLASVRADVVHVHLSVFSPFGLRAARHAARLGLPTVITVHSLWSDLAPAAPIVRPLSGAAAWPVVWTAVSDAAAVQVRRLTGAPVAVVPNAVDLDFWRPGFGAAPESPRPVVLSVMRLTTVKRAVPLVRMLRRAAAEAEFDAVIVGDGPQRAAVQRYLVRHRLEDRIRLTGALDRHHVRAALAQASIFVAPAWRESFGIAALEARTAGVPVVASAASGVATFITHGVDGMLAHDDAEMTQQIALLASDHHLRGDLAAYSRRVLPDYSWEAALRLNLGAYRAAEAWALPVISPPGALSGISGAAA